MKEIGENLYSVNGNLQIRVNYNNSLALYQGHDEIYLNTTDVEEIQKIIHEIWGKKRLTM
jgi:hypothetical protein